MRCTTRVKKIDAHRTKDEASPAAAKVLQVAAFPSDHSAICNCSASNGKMKPADCDGLCIYDGDNAEVANFKGKQFRAQLAEDGGIRVYSMPGATKDRAFNLGNALRALNDKNEAFWRSRYDEE